MYFDLNLTLIYHYKESMYVITCSILFCNKNVVASINMDSPSSLSNRKNKTVFSQLLSMFVKSFPQIKTSAKDLL